MPKKKQQSASDVTYCAFIDVLGFRNIIDDWETATAFYEDLVVDLFPQVTKISDMTFDAVDKLDIPDVRKTKIARLKSKVSWRIFSDSIILTCKDPYKLVVHAINLQYFSFLRGYFLRGSIACGRHLEFKSDSNFFVVSEALRDAYLGESQLAKVPRVIIHPDSLNSIEQLIFDDGKIANFSLLACLMQGEDSHWFINPFFFPFLGKELAAVFHDKLKTYSKTPFLNKYLWVGDLLNFVTTRPDRSGYELRELYYAKDKKYAKYLKDLCAWNPMANEELVHTWEYSKTFNTFFSYNATALNAAAMNFIKTSPFRDEFGNNFKHYR